MYPRPSLTISELPPEQKKLAFCCRVLTILLLKTLDSPYITRGSDGRATRRADPCKQKIAAAENYIRKIANLVKEKNPEFNTEDFISKLTESYNSYLGVYVFNPLLEKNSAYENFIHRAIANSLNNIAVKGPSGLIFRVPPESTHKVHKHKAPINTTTIYNVIYLFFTQQEINYLKEEFHIKSFISFQRIKNHSAYSYLVDASFNSDSQVQQTLIDEGHSFSYRDHSGISVFESIILGVYLGPCDFIGKQIYNQFNIKTVAQSFGYLLFDKERYRSFLKGVWEYYQPPAQNSCPASTTETDKFQPTTKYYEPPNKPDAQYSLLSNSVFWQPGIQYLMPCALVYLGYYWLYNKNDPRIADFVFFFGEMMRVTTAALPDELNYQLKNIPYLTRQLNLLEHATYKGIDTSYLQETLKTYGYKSSAPQHLSKPQLVVSEAFRCQQKLLRRLTLKGYLSTDWEFVKLTPGANDPRSSEDKALSKKSIIYFYGSDEKFFFRNEKNRTTAKSAIRLTVESMEDNYEFTLEISKDNHLQGKKFVQTALARLKAKMNRKLYTLKNDEHSSKIKTKKLNSKNKEDKLYSVNFKPGSPIVFLYECLTTLNIPYTLAHALISETIYPSKESSLKLLRETPRHKQLKSRELMSVYADPAIKTAQATVTISSLFAGDLSPARLKIHQSFTAPETGYIESPTIRGSNPSAFPANRSFEIIKSPGKPKQQEDYISFEGEITVIKYGRPSLAEPIPFDLKDSDSDSD